MVLADWDLARLEATAAELAAATPGALLSTVEVDVADPASVRAMFGTAERPLTGVVHCAGIVGVTQLTETTLDEWNRIVAVNLTGTFLVVQEAVNALTSGGAIVTLASLAAQASSHPATPRRRQV